jgi:hypothetical protein
MRTAPLLTAAALFFAALLTLGQTRVNLNNQSTGTNILPNTMYLNVTETNNGKVELFPGSYWNDFVRIQPFGPPPNSNAKCNIKPDGKTRPAYEFAKINDLIAYDDYLYICVAPGTWKRIKFDAF